MNMVPTRYLAGAYHSWTTLSTFLFIGPAAYALTKGSPLIAVVILMSMTFSIMYHASSEEKFIRIDKAGARLLILTNFWLLSISSSLIHLGLAVFCGLLAWWAYVRSTKNYQVNHTVWHILSVAITQICLMASRS